MSYGCSYCKYWNKIFLGIMILGSFVEDLFFRILSNYIRCDIVECIVFFFGIIRNYSRI